jgi:hypothetical protein
MLDKEEAQEPINPTNMFDFEFEEFFTFSACGKYVYVKRLFSNGRALYSIYDVNDPGENESPVSPHAYRAVRFPEVHRQTNHPHPMSRAGDSS